MLLKRVQKVSEYTLFLTYIAPCYSRAELPPHMQLRSHPKSPHLHPCAPPNHASFIASPQFKRPASNFSANPCPYTMHFTPKGPSLPSPPSSYFITQNLPPGFGRMCLPVLRARKKREDCVREAKAIPRPLLSFTQAWSSEGLGREEKSQHPAPASQALGC